MGICAIIYNTDVCPIDIGTTGKIVWGLMRPLLNKGHQLYTDNCSPLSPCTNTYMSVIQGLVEQSTKAEGCYDHKVVFMLSTVHTNTKVTVREHSANSDKEKLVCITDYIKFPGAVNVSDQALQPYMGQRKVLAWYKNVAIQLIHVQHTTLLCCTKK